MLDLAYIMVMGGIEKHHYMENGRGTNLETRTGQECSRPIIYTVLKIHHTTMGSRGFRHSKLGVGDISIRNEE